MYCISLSKIVLKIVTNLLNYRMLFKDILKFLRLDYRYSLHIALYFVIQGINIPKNLDNYVYHLKTVIKKL